MSTSVEAGRATARGEKRCLLGAMVSVTSYDDAVQRIVEAARQRRPLRVSALAVHGVMTAATDPEFRACINAFDLATPDGQPVRWGLNLIHRAGLTRTVRGTDLTLRTLEAAAREGLPVYFYGSTPDVLGGVVSAARVRFPGLPIAGAEPSLFRPASQEEIGEIIRRIESSGAQMLFVGLGCPRQELFVGHVCNSLRMPALAVGAAFDYLSGRLPHPPGWVTRVGLEWLWRLALEPRRLWRRYAILNPAYAALLTAQAARLWRPDPAGRPRTVETVDA